MKVFTLGLCLLLLPFSALAQSAADPYIVRNVVVDITADNAVNARNQAFVKAQSQAYKQLLQQLKQPTDRPAPDDVTLGRMVKDFELVSEHVASNRYRGNFTVHFDPAQVANVIGTPTPVTPTQPVTAQATPVVTDPAPQPVAKHLLTLTIPFATLVEWRQIQAKLQQTGQVTDMTIYAMQYKQADVRLLLLSPLPDFQAALGRLGYRLTAKGTDHYLLERGGA
jgi:hypothetical protein